MKRKIQPEPDDFQFLVSGPVPLCRQCLLQHDIDPIPERYVLGVSSSDLALSTGGS